MFIVDCPIFNVIKTYKKLARCRPTTWHVDKLGSHLLFFCLKLNGRFLMKYGLQLVLLVEINFVSLWTN
jgi:hypothetical protein